MNRSDRPSVVVCDDEELIRWSLTEHLEQEGYSAISCTNGREALEAVAEQRPALLLLDLKMPEMDGLSALEALRKRGDDLPVIVLSAHGGVDSVVQATRLGASAYLTKPFDLREVSLAVEKALQADQLRNEVAYLRTRQRAGYGDFIGTAPSLTPVFDTLSRLEAVDAPTVLITGESGTGKDVIARALHARGHRKEGVFVEIDCAALAETLIESELFGHERGAFTDAKHSKPGLFEVAADGVVFLDEIGEISLTTQAKLLRALEARTFKRVGGVQSLPMRAAVIAATNRDLRADVAEGRFREDLFFRLNVIPLHLPPLRDRAEDIAALVAHFVERFNRTLGRELLGVDREALAALTRYPWPGNVRELRNVLERSVLLSQGDELTSSDLPPEIRFGGTRGGRKKPADFGAFLLPEAGVDLEDVERSLVAQALARTEGNQSAAARLLGLTRYALRYRMQKFGLEGSAQ